MGHITPSRPECCPSCPRGYRAPLRCYCGHEDCPAFASYVDLRAVPVTIQDVDAKGADSWANREGASWIDKL